MNSTGLFLTHVWSDRIERHYARLVRETEGLVTWHLVRDHGHGDLRCETLSSDPAASVLPVRYERMRENGGIHGGFLDALIWPWLMAADSDFVWLMEYDVDFSGDWATFFHQFQTCSADLLTTMIEPRSDCPKWWWWPRTAAPARVSSEQMHRGFNPLMRISRRFVQDYKRNMSDPAWDGHYEFTLPTAAIEAGFDVEDIGGNGPLCPEERLNRNYRSAPQDDTLPAGTFVWRPARKRYYTERPKDFPDADFLYHPIKPAVRNWEEKPFARFKSALRWLKGLRTWR